MAADITSRLAEAERGYVERNPESLRLHERRAESLPGGNTRTVIHLSPFPLTIVRGEGARLTDADGHVYLDFLGEYTAGLYGHSHPVILDAIRTALEGGIVLGAPNRYETELAEAIRARFPSVEPSSPYRAYAAAPDVVVPRHVQHHRARHSSR